MGLMDNMAQASVVKKIHISDIRENILNQYDLENIEELAELILEKGQRSNGTVYYDNEQQDGKHYTLIGGNRRYCAIKYLFEQKKHDGMMECKVCEKPKDELGEKEMLLVDNAQREKKLKDRIWEVQVGLEIYNRDKQAGIIPTGTKARDYIGKKIGISGRQVQNILHEINKENEKKTGVKKAKNQSLVAMAKQIEMICDCKINLTDKAVTFKCVNTDDLNRLLEELGIQDKLNKLT